MLPELHRARAGLCVGLKVYIERMTHRSSIDAARFGSNSLTSMPADPCLVNLNGDGSSPPVVRSVRRLADSGRWPAYFSSAGFGSNRSICDGPPGMKRTMLCRALAANCGERAGVAEVAVAPRALDSPASMFNSPIDPSPAERDWMNARRDVGRDEMGFRAKRSPRW